MLFIDNSFEHWVTPTGAKTKPNPKPIPLSKCNGFYQCFWSKLLTSKSLLQNACSIAACFKKLASKSYFNKMTSTLLQKDWKNSGYFKKLVNLLQRIRDPIIITLYYLSYLSIYLGVSINYTSEMAQMHLLSILSIQLSILSIKTIYPLFPILEAKHTALAKKI